MYARFKPARFACWRASSINSSINGVALCSLHHKLFDRGVFTVTESLDVVVSEQANGSVGF